MEQVRLNNIKAYEYSCYQTLKCSWKDLIRYTVIQRTDRIRSEFRKSSQATSHYRHKLYKVMWKRWSLHTKILRAKAKAVAGQAGKFSLKRITFAGWRLVLERCHRQVFVLQCFFIHFWSCIHFLFGFILYLPFWLVHMEYSF
jgi:hypothetical protein